MNKQPNVLFERRENDVHRDKFDFKETFGSIPSTVKMFLNQKS